MSRYQSPVKIFAAEGIVIIQRVKRILLLSTNVTLSKLNLKATSFYYYDNQMQ